MTIMWRSPYVPRPSEKQVTSRRRTLIYLERGSNLDFLTVHHPHLIRFMCFLRPRRILSTSERKKGLVRVPMLHLPMLHPAPTKNRSDTNGVEHLTKNGQGHNFNTGFKIRSLRFKSKISSTSFSISRA